jgi:hypothetical protein
MKNKSIKIVSALAMRITGSRCSCIAALCVATIIFGCASPDKSPNPACGPCPTNFVPLIHNGAKKIRTQYGEVTVTFIGSPRPTRDGAGWAVPFVTDQQISGNNIISGHESFQWEMLIHDEKEIGIYLNRYSLQSKVY